MDHRVPLKLHTLLDFEGMHCRVEAVMGCGSNAIVYRGWYPDRLNPQRRHYVLIKELFPLHPQGKIWRNDQEGISVDAEASEFWEKHRRSFLVGNEVHLQLLADHPELVGANLNSFSYHGTMYSVLGYTDGRTLEAELASSKPDLRQTARRMLGLLDALEAFHKSGYLHMDISPDNIMLVGSGQQERIYLIDYNSERPIYGSDDPISCKPGYSSPEAEINALRFIGCGSDLYSVAVVFFHCLMGRSLTLEEQLCAKAPDGSMIPCLEEAPQTVKSMVRRIMRKGLNVVPGKRYQSTGQMRQAFCELIDRIDCVGVTHWALWENGRRSVDDWIRMNPSLRYVTEETRLYPMRLQQSSSMTLAEYLEQMMSSKGESGLILGQGGIGKTTLLLHTALRQGKHYSEVFPAVFYISLYGWKSADTHYVRNQILMRLRFKREMNTFADAAHALHRLLEKSLETKNGIKMPVVLLLLDGLNEVKGDISTLVQEINELTQLAGVRIIATSRNPVPSLELKTAWLTPLSEGDVLTVLGENGLMIPNDPAVVQLLRTPLILSLYVQASGAGKQPDVHSEEDLMRVYMDALYQKAVCGLPEGSAERWPVDAALRLVLPCIASECARTGGALTEERLLHIIELCWNALTSRALRRAFPEWIGRSKEIRGNAETPEQWYGTMIHSLLWQQLGLLMKETDGGYLIFHQRIGAYLAQDGNRLIGRICRGRWQSVASLMAAVACCVFLALAVFMPDSYNEKKSEQVIDSVAVCYSAYGYRLSEVHTLTEHLVAFDTQDFLAWYDRCLDALSQEAVLTVREKGYLTQVDTLCENGELVAWSKKPLDAENSKTMIQDASLLLEEYVKYLPLLKGWAQSQRAQTEYPAFPEVFLRLLDADALVMSKLYYSTCAPHLEAGNAVWIDSVKKTVASVPLSGAEPEESIEKLRDSRFRIEKELVQMAASVELICREEHLMDDGD